MLLFIIIPIITAEVIVVGADFFLIPKNKGIKLIPDIINAFIKVAGMVAIISPS